MTLLRFYLIVWITWALLAYVCYIPVSNKNNMKEANNYITKCLALGNNVKYKISRPGLRSNPIFYDKVKDAVIKECIKLEIIR